MWHLNGEPLPLDPGSGWPVIDGYQYPPSDPARLEAAGAVWIAPESAPEDWPSLALAALQQSDLVAIRSHKAGIAYPSEWRVYDDALRAIVNGLEGPLPERPNYPK